MPGRKRSLVAWQEKSSLVRSQEDRLDLHAEDTHMIKVINMYRDEIPELSGRTLAGLPAARWPDGYVYIGRAGKGLPGHWGNPIEIGKPCPECGIAHDRNATLQCYEHWMRRRILSEQDLREKLLALDGMTLVCFCSPKPCHGHVLSRLVEEIKSAHRP